MCMGGCGKSTVKTTANTGYTPKKMAASKSGYKPMGVPNAFKNSGSGFGKPAVRVSFSGKK